MFEAEVQLQNEYLIFMAFIFHGARSMEFGYVAILTSHAVISSMFRSSYVPPHMCRLPNFLHLPVAPAVEGICESSAIFIAKFCSSGQMYVKIEVVLSVA